MVIVRLLEGRYELMKCRCLHVWFLMLCAPVAVFVVVCCPCVFACDSGTVRDAAYHAVRDVHKLYLIANEGDAASDEAYRRIEAWKAERGKDLNIEIGRIAADDPAVSWTDYGIPSAPPSVPVTALFGQFESPRRSFVIDHWEPGPADEDLAVLLDSPGRQRLREALTQAWVVLLYSPAPGGKGDAAIEKAFDAVSRRWAVEQSPGIQVVTFDRTDPRERIPVGFAGIKPDDPAWVGVVFGKGKLLAPPLRGEDITEANVNRLVESLAAQCTCLQESMTIALSIPMLWDEALTSKVVGLAPVQGYTEIALDGPSREEKVVERIREDVSKDDRGVFRRVASTLAVAGGVVIVCMGFVFWRHHRRNVEGSGS